MHPDRFSNLAEFTSIHSHPKRYLALLLLLLRLELAGIFFIHTSIIPKTPYLFAGLIARSDAAELLEAAEESFDEVTSFVAEVADRLGVSTHSLYAWLKRYSTPPEQRQQDAGQQAEIRRLKAELRLVTDERDILKKAAAYFAKQSG